jgi:periplasmic divalent cation tolerance protein
MAEARIVLTTLADEQQAETFAAALVERRLAACVNIVGPIRSIYRWKGNVEREKEFLLIIKTTSEQASRLEAAFQELHPYELPERVELAVEGGSEEYLAWIAGEVQEE